MTVLKQHRKGQLRIEGRKLIGSFEISLSNSGDREVLMEWIAEIRKQIREFDKAKATVE